MFLRMYLKNIHVEPHTNSASSDLLTMLLPVMTQSCCSHMFNSWEVRENWRRCVSKRRSCSCQWSDSGLTDMQPNCTHTIVMCFCSYKRRTFSCGFVQIHILTDKNPPWEAVWWQSAARKECFELPSWELKGWFCKMLKGIPCHSVSLWKIHLPLCDKQPMNGGEI